MSARERITRGVHNKNTKTILHKASYYNVVGTDIDLPRELYIKDLNSTYSTKNYIFKL